MSSPVGNRPATAGMRSPKSCLKPSKQRRSASTRKLPNSPLKVTSPGRKSVTNWQQSYSPSLVQFSYQQTPARYALNVFSVIRLVIAAGAIAGIVLCALQTRSSTTESLQGNVLKLLFLAFSLLLSVFDLVQFHYNKLPHRVEAMLDLFLAASFLSFFVIGVLVRKWTPDIIFFVVSVFHILSFFNVLVRAHKISLQLQHLSTLTLRDVEKGEAASTKRSGSPIFAISTPPIQQQAYGNGLQRSKSITETITAIRSPCAELEGSNRWTIVSQKPIEYI